MPKSVSAYDRLVRLYLDSAPLLDQGTQRVDPHGVNSGLDTHTFPVNPERHDHFFEGGVPGALADPVDGDFDLSRAAGDCGQGII